MSILDEHITPHITTFADVSGQYGIVWGSDIQVCSTNRIIEDDLFEIFDSTPVLAPLELGRRVIDTFINGLGRLVLPIVDTKIPINKRFTFRLTEGTAIIGDTSFQRGIELLYCDTVIFAYFYTRPINEMILITQYYGETKKEELW